MDLKSEKYTSIQNIVVDGKNLSSDSMNHYNESCGALRAPRPLNTDFVNVIHKFI